MTPPTVTIICDIRQPWPHPWREHLPSFVRLQRAKLPVGDFVLAGHEAGVVVMRKSLSELLDCNSAARKQLEDELTRAAQISTVIVVMENDLPHRLRLGPECAHIIATICELGTRTDCGGFTLTDGPGSAAMHAYEILACQLLDISEGPERE